MGLVGAIPSVLASQGASGVLASDLLAEQNGSHATAGRDVADHLEGVDQPIALVDDVVLGQDRDKEVRLVRIE